MWDRQTGAVLADSEGSGRVFPGLHEGTVVFTPDGQKVVALQHDPSSSDDLDAISSCSTPRRSHRWEGRRCRSATLAGWSVSRPTVVRRSLWLSNADPSRPAKTEVLVVDLETRRIVHSTRVRAFDRLGGARNDTVTPDGRTVGLGGTHGDVVVVDAVTGEVSPVLHAHDDFVESVTFAPDKATFVTTGRDGAVKLWASTSQELLGSVLPLGPNHRVRASFLAPDRVVLAFDTGQIFEWDPRPDAWEAYACRVAGRNFTKAEWAELFPGQAYRTTCSQYPAGS